MLKIKKISAVSESQPLLSNINLEVKSGEIHAVMGPKHSGKSALAHAIGGHPSVQVTDGSILWNRKKILDIEPDERANLGIFISFQFPPEFDMITNWELTKEIFGSKIAESTLVLKYSASCDLFELGVEHGDRSSNGTHMTMSHAKRNELVQMVMSDPKLIVLDEIDEGLSEQETASVGAIIKSFLTTNPEKGCIVITHNQLLLDILKPTHVHVMVGGEIKLSGSSELYTRIIEDGYSEFS
jgi:Fe-S cluster assembly ATP-binding protein